MELPVNEIICGDNCDVMRHWPDGCIDLVVTSPPYDDLRKYGGHDWDFYGVAWNLKRLIKDGGVIVWIVGDQCKDGSETGTSMRQALHFQEMGLRIHDTMIYQKSGFSMPGIGRYNQVWEYAFVFSKGKPITFNPIMDRHNVSAGRRLGGDYKRNESGESVVRPGSGSRGYRRAFGQRFNVWRYSIGGTADGIANKHPAIFPEALAEDHIVSWSNEGDIVLDPFIGSGTTAKMAKKNGRRFIGIDANLDYCELAKKRIELVEN